MGYTGYAQDKLPPDLPVESYTGGPPVAWSKQDNALYLARGRYLLVYELRGQETPRLCHSILLEHPCDKMWDAPNRLYLRLANVACPKIDQKLVTVDISERLAPTIIDGPKLFDYKQARDESEESLETTVHEWREPTEEEPNNPRALAIPPLYADLLLVSETLLWMREPTQGWFAYDVANPNAPRPLGYVTLPAGEAPLQLIGRDIYCRSKNSGLSIYQADVPGTCSLIRTLPMGADVLDFDHDGTSAVVALGLYGLRLLDVTNADQPQVMLDLATSGSCTSARISGDWIGYRDTQYHLLHGDAASRVNECATLAIDDLNTSLTRYLGLNTTEFPYTVTDWSLGDGLAVLIWRQATENEAALLDERDRRYGERCQVLRFNTAGELRTEAPTPKEPESCIPRGIARGRQILFTSWAFNSQDKNYNFSLLAYGASGEPQPIASAFDFSPIRDYAIAGQYLYVLDQKQGLIVLQLPQQPAVNVDDIR